MLGNNTSQKEWKGARKDASWKRDTKIQQRREGEERDERTNKGCRTQVIAGIFRRNSVSHVLINPLSANQHQLLINSAAVFSFLALFLRCQQCSLCYNTAYSLSTPSAAYFALWTNICLSAIGSVVAVMMEHRKLQQPLLRLLNEPSFHQICAVSQAKLAQRNVSYSCTLWLTTYVGLSAHRETSSWFGSSPRVY